MQLEEIRRVAVIGAGLMGHGIAQEFAVAGYEVALNDVSEERLARAIGAMCANLRQLADLGLVPPERAAAAPDEVRTTSDLAAAAGEIGRAACRGRGEI